MNDVGYSRMVVRQADVMHRMMKRLGVDVMHATSIDGGLPWHEAATKCLFCCHAQRCCAWLDGLEVHTDPAKFGPNSEFFRSCCSEIRTQRSIIPVD